MRGGLWVRSLPPWKAKTNFEYLETQVSCQNVPEEVSRQKENKNSEHKEGEGDGQKGEGDD